MGSLTPDQELRGLLTDLLDGREPWDLLEREHVGRGPRAAVRLLAQTFRLAAHGPGMRSLGVGLFPA